MKQKNSKQFKIKLASVMLTVLGAFGGTMPAFASTVGEPDLLGATSDENFKKNAQLKMVLHSMFVELQSIEWEKHDVETFKKDLDEVMGIVRGMSWGDFSVNPFLGLRGIFNKDSSESGLIKFLEAIFPEQLDKLSACVGGIFNERRDIEYDLRKFRQIWDRTVVCMIGVIGEATRVNNIGSIIYDICSIFFELGVFHRNIK